MPSWLSPWRIDLGLGGVVDPPTVGQVLVTEEAVVKNVGSKRTASAGERSTMQRSGLLTGETQPLGSLDGRPESTLMRSEQDPAYVGGPGEQRGSRRGIQPDAR